MPGIVQIGRSPHGERGLKYSLDFLPALLFPSLPARGAWIEIATVSTTDQESYTSLPARGAWIEIP